MRGLGSDDGIERYHNGTCFVMNQTLSERSLTEPMTSSHYLPLISCSETFKVITLAETETQSARQQ
jgi:hypothetical protein